MNLNANVLTLFTLALLTLASCKKDDMDEPVSGYFDLSLTYSDVEIIDLCAGKFSVVLQANSNNQELATYSWNIFGQADYSTEQSVEVTFEGRETHDIFLSVTNTDGRSEGKNKSLNIELFLYERTEPVIAEDEYGFSIATVTTDPAYTNETITFKTALEHDDLWWEIIDASGNSEIVQGTNQDGFNIAEKTFTEAGTIIAKSFFCEEKYAISEKEISIEIVDELPFSSATIQSITLEHVAENSSVEVYFEILVDGDLKLRTTKKDFQGPTNQGVNLDWFPENDLEIGEESGVIGGLTSLDTEMELRMFVNDTEVLSRTIKADYLGHFPMSLHLQSVELEENGYKASVVFE